MERKTRQAMPRSAVKLTTLCLLALLSVSTQVQAGEGKCVSMFSKIADQMNKVVPTYVDLRMEAAQALVGVILPTADLDELTEKMKDVQIGAYKAIGEVVGDKATPGAVNLTVPYFKYQGKSYAERTFHVSNSGFDRVKVKVKKTGGKNGADIVVCKYTTDGNYIKSKTVSIDKGKDTAGKERTVEFKGMKNDKYLTVHVINKGWATDKFDYNLTVTGEFDTAKLAKEKPAKKKVVSKQLNPSTTIR